MSYDFNELCLAHYHELLTFATKRTRNKAAAEDIVQESVIKALKRWDRWEPQGDPAMYARAWMFRIVANTFALEYRQNKSHARMLNDEHKTICTELYQNEVQEHPYLTVDTIGDEVREALSRIRPEWAEIIQLVYIDGVYAKDVAVMLNLAPGTVRSRMARGRLALARILSPLARRRFGFGSTSRSTDETSGALQTPELPEQNSYGINSVVTENDTAFLDL